MKNWAALVLAAALTPGAFAGFIIEDAPEPAGSWTQRIVLRGNFDYVAFEIVEQAGGGPFDIPSFDGLTDPDQGDEPMAGWNPLVETPDAVAAFGPDTDTMAVTLHFDGSIFQSVEFRGVAFLNGEFQFSASFLWDGYGGFGSPMVLLTDYNVWQPDTMPVGNPIPLPPAVWLGAMGLFGVVIVRRRKT